MADRSYWGCPLLGFLNEELVFLLNKGFTLASLDIWSESEYCLSATFRSLLEYFNKRLKLRDVVIPPFPPTGDKSWPRDSSPSEHMVLFPMCLGHGSMAKGSSQLHLLVMVPLLTRLVASLFSGAGGWLWLGPPTSPNLCASQLEAHQQ